MEVLKIGLIGVSHRAKIADNWHNDKRAVITAGCDIIPEYLKDFQKKYGSDTFITEDYSELVTRDDVDVIAIFTPDNVHADPLPRHPPWLD